MWSAGTVKSEQLRIEPLSEAAAIDMGAEMLGELVIYTVGVSAIVLEYWRQRVNAARKEKKQDDALRQLRKELDSLTQVVESRQRAIDKMTNILENYQSKEYKLVKADRKREHERLKPQG